MNRAEEGFARWFDHLRRLLGPGLSFVLFGVGGVFLSLLVFAPMNLIIADHDRRQFIAQIVVHHIFRLFVHTMIALGVIDLEIIDGIELQRDRGRIIISNHPSLIDVVLIISLVRQMQCVVKHQNWRNPFMRGVLAATGYVRNDDDPARLVDSCVQALREQPSDLSRRIEDDAWSSTPLAARFRQHLPRGGGAAPSGDRHLFPADVDQRRKVVSDSAGSAFVSPRSP